MTQTPIVSPGKLFAQVLDPASRANPYPLYARLRQTPVSVQEDGTYVVSTYREISLLLHDPRISSDERKSAHGAGALAASGRLSTTPPFIFTDPPEHTQLRGLVMHQFTPQRIAGMQEHIEQAVNALLDAKKQQNQLDVVQDFAYPLPVTIICRLLGVPREDEPRFRVWSSALVRTLDPKESLSEAEAQQAVQSRTQMREYMKQLSATRCAHPQNDLFSGLVAGDDPDGRLSEPDLLATMELLLIAGHETTVNLIGNGLLALHRNPDQLALLNAHPSLITNAIEEFLRYDSSVQMGGRVALEDIDDLGGKKIPKGEGVLCLLGSANHDPAVYPDRPDRLDITRPNVKPLSFGGGIHFCLGAQLARIEAEIAISTLLRRLPDLRLDDADNPEWRPTFVLRGLKRLPASW
jgi:cytochrome P450